MPGPDDVDQNQLKRSDAALARRFEEFAEFECAASGSGMSVDSPTYAVLSRHIATHADLLALARECRVGQPIPNLMFAAVKRVVQDAPASTLAAHFERAAEGSRPAPGLPGAFAQLCAEHRPRILALLESRNVQTNEVGRCSHLMPAFGIVARTTRQPLALIDVGAGAGLNLLWDQYDYRYSNGSVFGTGRSPVRIVCESRGPMPDMPARFPEVAYRVGIDLEPIDLTDEDQYRWLQALVWPDHADRAALLANARRVWLQHTPRVLAGDAVESLPKLIGAAPPDAALCVFHCHVLNQFPVSARAAFSEALQSASRQRPVYYIASEGEHLNVTRIVDGRSHALLSVLRNAHGRWVDWLGR
ncbi:MAG: DUF2332 domain-containing protein [Gammaproteobacteria bacterium]|nr:DUF2332 domain-containing protein [Gammaproteobacteria bacterium]